jgi:hypothetical protein
MNLQDDTTLYEHVSTSIVTYCSIFFCAEIISSISAQETKKYATFRYDTVEVEDRLNIPTHRTPRFNIRITLSALSTTVSKTNFVFYL